MEPTSHPGNAGSGGVHLPPGLHPGSGPESKTAGGSRRRVRDLTATFGRSNGQSNRLENTASRGTRSSKPPRAPKWWKIRLFRGMINDVRRRAPYYWSDWKDAWDYRVVPATVYMYFAKYECPYCPAFSTSASLFC